ncbi:hypothetical protein N9N67_04600 [Bacteriovoracaceae bacterium]|nr:hypothetical protein [Bacteriovoracaceae bacterium]
MYFKKCGKCAKEIPFGGLYYVCSVSSCRKHTYCSVDCWQLHNEVLSHKAAWSEENRAPKFNPNTTEKKPIEGKRRIISSPKPNISSTTNNANVPMDILVVVSKMKAYVKAKHDINVSGGVNDALSDIIRHACDQAAEKAKIAGRKTLMDRDF